MILIRCNKDFKTFKSGVYYLTREFHLPDECADCYQVITYLPAVDNCYKGSYSYREAVELSKKYIKDYELKIITHKNILHKLESLKKEFII
jgi:hypothetical protein